MADFTMPSLGADMATGQVVEWLVTPGDRVKPGDVVAVVETHKGAIDVECFLTGVIDDLAPLGQDLPVGAVLAHVRAETQAAAAGPAPSPPSPAASPAASPAPPFASPSASQPPGAAPAAAAEGKRAVASPQAVGQPPRLKLSPAARREAERLGLDPSGISGTGVDGAVTLADVARAAASPQPPAPAPKRGFDPAQMRLAIAAAMARSKREIPHYYLGDTIDFAAAERWLADHNRDRAPEERLLAATLLLKASAVALREEPQLNGFYEDGAYRPGPGIHVGWAISLRGGGLVAPAIHDADRQTLPELMGALRDLVQRARAGRLRSSEMTDPTVTVTSLGERGARSVLGVIYPPQVAIIGFGRVAPGPWVVDGQVVARPLVDVSLAADHRASDGHQGGQLLAAINRALQSPENL